MRLLLTSLTRVFAANLLKTNHNPKGSKFYIFKFRNLGFPTAGNAYRDIVVSSGAVSLMTSLALSFQSTQTFFFFFRKALLYRPLGMRSLPMWSIRRFLSMGGMRTALANILEAWCWRAMKRGPRTTSKTLKNGLAPMVHQVSNQLLDVIICLNCYLGRCGGRERIGREVMMEGMIQAMFWRL